MPRFIQHPETGKLIPAEEYVRPGPKTHMIMPDVEPFQSPVDKSWITTRSQLREHNERHGVTNTADFPPEYVKSRAIRRLEEQKRNDKTHRTQLIQKALHKLERG